MLCGPYWSTGMAGSQEGGRVVWGRRAMRCGEVDGFGGGEGFGRVLRFWRPVRRGYGDAGGSGGGAADAVGKGGEQEEEAGGEGVAPGVGDAHVGEGAGGAD